MNRKLIYVITALLPLMQFVINANCTAPNEDKDSIALRIARISFLEGSVSMMRTTDEDWTKAMLNTPLLVDDKLYTGVDGRAELQLEDDIMAHQGKDTYIHFLSLDDSLGRIDLQKGTLAIDANPVKYSRPPLEIISKNFQTRITSSTTVRYDVFEDGSAEIQVVQGEVRVHKADDTFFIIQKGDCLVIPNDDPSSYTTTDLRPADNFDKWCDLRAAQLASANHAENPVSRRIAGVSDLDRYGDWVDSDQYGRVWHPRVAATWTPYYDGEWTWREPYGWAWVSYEPWGWAPYHYGRWVHVRRHNWCWVPWEVREVVYRPAWHPALVSFTYASQGRYLNFQVGGGGGYYGGSCVGWFPLGPHDPYIPWYSPHHAYVDPFSHRIRDYHGGSPYVTNVIINNNHIYENQKVANAITAMPVRDFNSGNFRTKAPVTVSRMRADTVKVGSEALPMVAQGRVAEVKREKGNVQVSYNAQPEVKTSRQRATIPENPREMISPAASGQTSTISAKRGQTPENKITPAPATENTPSRSAERGAKVGQPAAPDDKSVTSGPRTTENSRSNEVFKDIKFDKATSSPGRSADSVKSANSSSRENSRGAAVKNEPIPGAQSPAAARNGEMSKTTAPRTTENNRGAAVKNEPVPEAQSPAAARNGETSKSTTPRTSENSRGAAVKNEPVPEAQSPAAARNGETSKSTTPRTSENSRGAAVKNEPAPEAQSPAAARNGETSKSTTPRTSENTRGSAVKNEPAPEAQSPAAARNGETSKSTTPRTSENSRGAAVKNDSKPDMQSSSPEKNEETPKADAPKSRDSIRKTAEMKDAKSDTPANTQGRSSDSSREKNIRTTKQPANNPDQTKGATPRSSLRSSSRDSIPQPESSRQSLSPIRKDNMPENTDPKTRYVPRTQDERARIIDSAKSRNKKNPVQPSSAGDSRSFSMNANSVYSQNTQPSQERQYQQSYTERPGVSQTRISSSYRPQPGVYSTQPSQSTDMQGSSSPSRRSGLPFSRSYGAPSDTISPSRGGDIPVIRTPQQDNSYAPSSRPTRSFGSSYPTETSPSRSIDSSIGRSSSGYAGTIAPRSMNMPVAPSTPSSYSGNSPSRDSGSQTTETTRRTSPRR